MATNTELHTLLVFFVCLFVLTEVSQSWSGQTEVCAHLKQRFSKTVQVFPEEAQGRGQWWTVRHLSEGFMIIVVVPIERNEINFGYGFSC